MRRFNKVLSIGLSSKNKIASLNTWVIPALTKPHLSCCTPIHTSSKGRPWNDKFGSLIIKKEINSENTFRLNKHGYINVLQSGITNTLP